jgi:hypothetical protein
MHNVEIPTKQSHVSFKACIWRVRFLRSRFDCVALSAEGPIQLSTNSLITR